VDCLVQRDVQGMDVCISDFHVRIFQLNCLITPFSKDFCAFFRKAPWVDAGGVEVVKFKWAVVFFLGLIGCGAPEYVSDAPGRTTLPPTKPSGEGAAGTNKGPSTGEQVGKQNTKTGPEEIAVNPCVKERKILVVDLKSGWFAGDGGDFFNKVTSDVCGGMVKIHYVHFTTGSIDSNINPSDVAECTGPFCTAFKDITTYDQFWILSGDEADGADVRLSSPLFQSILSRAVELRDANPKAGFYFGAGLGNIHHANALAKTLFPQLAGSDVNPDVGLFSANPSGQRGVLPSSNLPNQIGERPLVAGNGSVAGSFDALSRPFKAFGPYANSMGTLFDYQDGSQSMFFGFNCLTDPVAPAGAGVNAVGYKVVATDHCGKSAIAIANPGGHLVMADGNTARHYGYANNPGAYFHRAILSLLQ